jgi:hypothetical protein
MIAGFSLAAQRSDVPDPVSSQALTAEETILNLGLIEPTSMLGRVMDGEALPKPSARRIAETVHQRLAGVGVKLSTTKWMVSAAQ